MKTINKIVLSLTTATLFATSAFAACGGNIEMNTHIISGLGAPVAALDAVNKEYADALVAPSNYETGVCDSQWHDIPLMWDNNIAFGPSYRAAVVHYTHREPTFVTDLVSNSQTVIAPADVDTVDNWGTALRFVPDTGHSQYFCKMGEINYRNYRNF